MNGELFPGAVDDDGALAEGHFRPAFFSGQNAAIRTSQAAIWYRDALIVGTGRPPLGKLGRHNAAVGIGRRAGQARHGRGRADGLDLHGAQVWRCVPTDGGWELVYESPQSAGLDGVLRARDRSIRAATVYQTAQDREPVLYLGVGSLERQVVFLRSEDGRTFEESEQPGLGFGADADTPSVRCLCGLNGRLYTSPTGKNYGRGLLDDNCTDFPVVLETDDPIRGRWRAVSEPGFGDPNNLSVNEIGVLDGHLYAATINARRGYQVWKTDARGTPPYRWQKILEDGAWAGPTSAFPSAMFSFRGALYVTGTIPRQGRGGLNGARLDAYGPFPAEMVRIRPDDTWDLVAGKPRFTAHGLKRPVSGMLGGFDHRYTHVFWRMAQYGEWMYVGTADWRWMPIYLSAERADLSEEQLERLVRETEAYEPPEFRLWRTRDGVDWTPVTLKGLGNNPNNYGIRELVATPHGLFVLPTSKRSASAGGGLEMWWGAGRFG